MLECHFWQFSQVKIKVMVLRADRAKLRRILAALELSFQVEAAFPYPYHAETYASFLCHL
jgi:hypothetical protein